MSGDLYIILSTFVIFAITFLFAVMPYKKKGFMKPRLGLKLLNAFTGGMFLSIGLVHIMPEAQEMYNKKSPCSHNH